MSNLFDKLFSDSKDEITLSESDLEIFWDEITGTDQSSDAINARFVFIDQFKQLASSELKGDELYLRTKSWKISMKKNLIKSGMLTPTLVGILTYLGVTQISVILLPTIIPILFDMENIELSRKDEEILMKLPINKSKKEYKTTDQWYKSLPHDILKQLNYLDFVEFMDKLVLAGFAKQDDHKFKIFRKGKNKFKIIFD